jgi:hypothetical protein
MMNWRRGFRRIAFVLGVVAAAFFAGSSVLLVLVIHSGAQSQLQWEQERYEELRIPSFEEMRSGRAPTLEEVKKRAEPHRQRVEELKNGFWVNLSKGELVGVCTLAGVVGAVIGFAAICLAYRLLEWLVLGFCQDTG